MLLVIQNKASKSFPHDLKLWRTFKTTRIKEKRQSFFLWHSVCMESMHESWDWNVSCSPSHVHENHSQLFLVNYDSKTLYNRMWQRVALFFFLEKMIFCPQVQTFSFTRNLHSWHTQQKNIVTNSKFVKNETILIHKYGKIVTSSSM
jgi:hypothetical protein